MDSKRQLILQSAIDVITRYGYRRTSMEDIAQQAGISRPAIYQLFKNKEAVATATIELVGQQGFDSAEAAIAGIESEHERLKTYVTAYMVFYYRLIVSGPHSQELLQVKRDLGKNQPDAGRRKLAERLNELMGLHTENEAGFVLGSAAEGIKMAAGNEETLCKRLLMLVDRFQK